MDTNDKINKLSKELGRKWQGKLPYQYCRHACPYQAVYQL